jgi:hypothetical protein
MSDSTKLKRHFGYPPTTPPKRSQTSPGCFNNSMKSGWVGGSSWKECLKHKLPTYSPRCLKLSAGPIRPVCRLLKLHPCQDLVASPQSDAVLAEDARATVGEPRAVASCPVRLLGHFYMSMRSQPPPKHPKTILAIPLMM